VGLIVNAASMLYALTDEYIDPSIQTTMDSGTTFYHSCTTPEFISNIWRRIKDALIAKLDTDIQSIDFPLNYNELNAVQKCEHVRHILEKLDTIYNNLYPGAVSFFSHTLQGLSGDLKDKVNSRPYTVARQQDAIQRFAEITQKSILFITGDMQDFSRRFLTTKRNQLPQMCYFGKKCSRMKNIEHKKWFVHPLGDTPFYFESLVPTEKSLRAANPYGGFNSLRSKINLKKTKHIRFKRTRRHTRRRTKHRRH
jgi:hypothetical protein